MGGLARIAIGTRADTRAVRAVLLAAGAAAVVAGSVAAAVLPRPLAILADNVQQLVASAAGAALLALTWRTRDGAHRTIAAALGGALACAAAGQLVWDVQPGGSTSVSLLADAIFLVAASLGLTAVAEAIFRPLAPAVRAAAALDAVVLFFTGLVVIAAVWNPDIAYLRDAGELPALATASALIAGSAAGWIGLMSGRVQPGIRGGWAVIDGLLAIGVAWISWLDLSARGHASEVAPADVLFSVGVLLVAWGGATWDELPPASPGFRRFASGVGTLFPIVAMVVAVGLMMVSPADTRWVVGAATAVVVVAAALRQVVSLRDERAAREAERAASLELARVVRERAETLVSLSRLEPGATPEETARRICAEALRLAGIDVAVIGVFSRSDDLVTLGLEGLRVPGIEPGRPLPRERAARVAERAGGDPWVDVFPAETSDPYVAAVRRGGLCALANAGLRWETHVIGSIGLGSRSPEATSALEDRLPMVQEFAVVAAALLGPAIAERDRLAATREAIDRIIDRAAFFPVFQPIVELGSGRIAGYEALTRFADGTRPDLRFADAEEAGAGPRLESACLRAAIAEAAGLPRGAWLSLNVSPALATALLPLVAALEDADRDVVLEITEHVPIGDYTRLVEALGALGGGVRISVDDAGAGYAGLRHILELRPHFVKLDIALVRSVDSDPARRALIASMAAFARETGCTLIAEGIETTEELEALRTLGVTMGQGYLLGRPAPLG